MQFSCSNTECLKFLHLVQFCQPHSSTDIFLDGEEGTFFSLHEESINEETIALLKKKSQNDTGHNYKLGETMELQLDLQVTLAYANFSSCGFVLHVLSVPSE